MNEHWKIEQRDYGTVLTLLDEWDLDRVNEFSNFISEKLKPEKEENFVVDLNQVDYIDSMALGVLINLHRRYKEEGGFVYLLKPSKPVEDILKQSGVYRIFEVFQSEEDLVSRIESKKQEQKRPGGQSSAT